VRILLSVERAAPVTTATVATIITRGLAARGFTGYVYVALEDTRGDSTNLVARRGEDYPVIPAAPAKSASLDTAISRMDENMQRISERMNEVLDARMVASLKQSVDNLQRVTKTLADNNAKLNALIVNGERASRQLDPLLSSSNETVKALQTQILPETHRALASLDNLNRQLQPLVASSNDTLNALQTQILPEAHRTLTDLDDLSTSLSGFANKVKKDPSVIVRGAAAPPLGPGER
jgi:phospholipid/cholesterol/gamma-HCH transport system substrate-binding protein